MRVESRAAVRTHWSEEQWRHIYSRTVEVTGVFEFYFYICEDDEDLPVLLVTPIKHGCG